MSGWVGGWVKEWVGGWVGVEGDWACGVYEWWT